MGVGRLDKGVGRVDKEMMGITKKENLMDYVIFPKRKELNMRLVVTFQKRKFLKRKFLNRTCGPTIQKRKELNIGLAVTFQKRYFHFRKFWWLT